MWLFRSVIISRLINPSCAFGAALLQRPAFRWITPTIENIGSKCPLREGGSPKGRGWIRLAEAGAAKQLKALKSPVFPRPRKISRLLEAVAILTVFSCSMIPPLEMTGAGWSRTSGIPPSPMCLFLPVVISRPNHPSCGFATKVDPPLLAREGGSR